MKIIISIPLTIHTRGAENNNENTRLALFPYSLHHPHIPLAFVITQNYVIQLKGIPNSCAALY